VAINIGVGIVGCGNISSAYMALGPLFKGIEVKACADINPDAAKARAQEFGIDALSVDEMLARKDIDIVVNLTIPSAHFDIGMRVLDAGKHLYSEKPFVLSKAEGEQLLEKAAKSGLRVGSAPDTFLGGSHQLARQLIDQGEVGKILSGTAVVQSHGLEDWHPNPDFFYQPGAGPVLDIGPYYISNLVQLIGPVKEVLAMTSTGQSTRTIGNGPREGEKISVTTPTTIHSLLRFENGAHVTMLTSWDVWSHTHENMQLYGEHGSLFIPDPNFFGGKLRMTKNENEVALPAWEHPFLKENFGDDNEHANYRGAGLSDMAQAIGEGRPHRCSAEFAHHVVDVMTSILKAGESNGLVSIDTTCERPEPLDAAAASALMV